MTLSKKNQKLSKANKELFLQGKPFLYPRRLDIHRHAVHCHIRENETEPNDIESTFITNVGWGSAENCTGNAKGRIWLHLSHRFLTSTIKFRVGFHELDFDITVDSFGYAFKEIDGETVKIDYDSNL